MAKQDHQYDYILWKSKSGQHAPRYVVREFKVPVEEYHTQAEARRRVTQLRQEAGRR